jgi:hypothetical protein
MTPTRDDIRANLDARLAANQDVWIPARADNQYMVPGETFSMDQLGRGGGEPLKIHPEAGRADHPLLGFPGHKDVIERLPSGEVVKFRIPYNP